MASILLSALSGGFWGMPILQCDTAFLYVVNIEDEQLAYKFHLEIFELENFVKS
jgi:hypothetical protein